METAENKFAIIHETLGKANNTLSVKMLCEIAGVSRSGYYNWVKAADTRNEKERQDRADFELILMAYSFRGYDKGAQGIYMRLLHMEPPVIMNVKKIRRLMKNSQVSRLRMLGCFHVFSNLSVKFQFPVTGKTSIF